MKIILTGPKCSGKSTIGRRLAECTGLPFVETDSRLEELYFGQTGVRRSCREICSIEGEASFRAWEARAAADIAGRDWCVIATGGGTMLDTDSRGLLASGSILVLIKAPIHLLWDRLQAAGLPPFLSCADGLSEYQERVRRLYEATEHLADIVFTVTSENENDAHRLIMERLAGAMLLRMRSPSSFGEVLRVTTFGESHGPAVGAVLDGVPPMIDLSEVDVQRELDRRRPGQSGLATPRNEEDRVHILSGVFDGKTTGTPICMLIYNRDQDSSKYEALRDVFRPGHADFTFWKKYGIRDYRGGGRSSGRETAGRVAAGAVAKKILAEQGISVTAFAQEIAGIRGESEDYGFIERNPVRAADPSAAKLMEETIVRARAEKDSVGGVVKLVARNVPAGLGDPVFYKIDARLAMALFSIGAVKGVEIGAGFESAQLRGSENNDPMRDGAFLSNNAGGVLGGITTGQDIVVRVAVKPTPSIFRGQETIDTGGHNRSIAVEGRHDPCIVPRIVPVVEAMAAIVLLDALEIQRKIKGDS
jgi:chorismate synthase